MPRAIGDKNKGANEYSRLYEQMVIEENVNPVRVLFKLMKSRVQTVRLQAAATALKYRFPTQAAAKLEVEQAKQMIMTWDEVIEHDPPALVQLDGSEPLDQREFVRHEVEETDIPL
jgi:hypothetical protein